MNPLILPRNQGVHAPARPVRSQNHRLRPRQAAPTGQRPSLAQRRPDGLRRRHGHPQPTWPRNRPAAPIRLPAPLPTSMPWAPPLRVAHRPSSLQGHQSARHRPPGGPRRAGVAAAPATQRPGRSRNHLPEVSAQGSRDTLRQRRRTGRRPPPLAAQRADPRSPHHQRRTVAALVSPQSSPCRRQRRGGRAATVAERPVRLGLAPPNRPDAQGPPQRAQRPHRVRARSTSNCWPPANRPRTLWPAASTSRPAPCASR